MKLEIIKETSFEEHNERFFYTPLKDEKEELSRREFLKYLTIGSAGLLVPVGMYKNAEANPFMLIGVIFGAIKLVYEITKEDKPIIVTPYEPPIIHINNDVHCDIQLVNGGHKTVRGMLECKNKHRKSKKVAYKTVKRKRIKTAVKAGSTITARVNLTKSSKKEGDYVFSAKSKKDKAKIKYKRG